MNQQANRDREPQWIEEARKERLEAIRSPEDAARFIAEFGLRPTDHKFVFAIRQKDFRDELLVSNWRLPDAVGPEKVSGELARGRRRCQEEIGE